MKTFGILTVVAIVLLGTPAQADVACSSKVLRTRLEAYGVFSVGMSWAIDTEFTICNTRQDFPVQAGNFGAVAITPAQCQALIAQFTTTAARQQTVRAYFGGITQCPTNPDLSSNYPQTWWFE